MHARTHTHIHTCTHTHMHTYTHKHAHTNRLPRQNQFQETKHMLAFIGHVPCLQMYLNKFFCLCVYPTNVAVYCL